MLIIEIIYFFSVWSLLSCPMTLPHVLYIPQIEGSSDACLPALLPGLRLPLHWVCHAISVDLKGIQYEAVTLVHETQCCLTVGLRSYLKLGIVAYVIPAPHPKVRVIFGYLGSSRPAWTRQNSALKHTIKNELFELSHIENVSKFECITLCLYVYIISIITSRW